MNQTRPHFLCSLIYFPLKILPWCLLHYIPQTCLWNKQYLLLNYLLNFPVSDFYSMKQTILFYLILVKPSPSSRTGVKKCHLLQYSQVSTYQNPASWSTQRFLVHYPLISLVYSFILMSQKTPFRSFLRFMWFSWWCFLR